MTRVGPPRTAVLLACLAVLVSCAALALLTPWALLPAPFAVALGVAAWLGAGLGATWEALARTGDDAGSGPAGLAP